MFIQQMPEAARRDEIRRREKELRRAAEDARLVGPLRRAKPRSED